MEEKIVSVNNADYVNCACGTTMNKVISLVSDISAPKIKDYDCFREDNLTMTYSEKQRYLKKNNLQESGDRYKGSRSGVFKSINEKVLKDKREKINETRTKDLGKCYMEAKRCKITKTL